MQRKSINEPKKSREIEQDPSRAPAPRMESRSRPRPSPLPPTQIVDRESAGLSRYAKDTLLRTPAPVPADVAELPVPGLALASRPRGSLLPAPKVVNRSGAGQKAKANQAPLQTVKAAPLRQSAAPAPSTEPLFRLQADNLPATQTVVRSSDGKSAFLKDAEPLPSNPVPRRQLIVKLPSPKRKLEEDTPRPRLTRSQAKKSQESNHVKLSASTTQKRSSPVKTQNTREPPAKRKKANNTRALPGVPPTAPEVSNDSTDVSQNAANLVKTSPRKAAMATKRQSCNPCSKLHTSCDHERPVCGNCQKRSQPGACVYVSPPVNQPMVAAPRPTSPKKKKTAKPTVCFDSDSPTMSGGRSGLPRNDNRSSAKSMSVEKRTPPARSSMSRESPCAAPNAATPAVTGPVRPFPSSASTAAPLGRQRLPAIASYEEYRDLMRRDKVV